MKQSITYHNTNNIVGLPLQEALEKAANQEQRILLIFKENNNKAFSASQIHEMYLKNLKINLMDFYATPLTSIRRAMCNLVYDGKIIKTENQRSGLFGKKEYLYKPV